MATDLGAQKSRDEIGEINKYDFHTETTAVFKARKGIDRGDRGADFGDEERAGLDA